MLPSKKLRIVRKFSCAISIALSSSPLAAQNSDRCGSVLTPNTESIKSDYSILQAYAKINSDELYEKFKSSEGNDTGLKLGGGGYYLDFKQSKNKDDFKSRVQTRLEKENFSMSETEAKAISRKGVSDAQVKEWGRCIAGGGVIAIPKNIVPGKGFTLNIDWYPSRNVGEGTLEIEVEGGRIRGQRKFSEKIFGITNKSYQVVADSRSPITVITNIAGDSDTFLVKQIQPKPAIVCLTQDQVKRHSENDNHLLAPLNNVPCFSHRSSAGTRPNIDAWYRIKIERPGLLSVLLTEMTTEFALQIRAAEGNVVALPSPARASGSQYVDFAVVRPGEYLVRAQPYTGPSDYNLRVTFAPW